MGGDWDRGFWAGASLGEKLLSSQHLARRSRSANHGSFMVEMELERLFNYRNKSFIALGISKVVRRREAGEGKMPRETGSAGLAADIT